MLVKFTKADVIVTTSLMDSRTDVPVFSGVPLLTGIGQKELYDQIFSAIQAMKD